MDAFAREPGDIRAEAFRETAARMNVQPAIVEKDFWVSWTLKRAFSLDKPIPSLIFKGGTSLSKVYGVIRRFSEDIDLSLDRHDLGFKGARDPLSEMSGAARKALLKELEETAAAAVAGPVKNALGEAIEHALGAEANLKVADDNAQTLLFTYPQSLSVDDQRAYLPPFVRLEFGARSDHLPFVDGEITPFIHAEFPELLNEPTIKVKTLAAERTFWEKATILHMLFHRDPEKPLGERMSRHYYDVVQLARSRVKDQALGDLKLLDAVAEHKSVFFKAAWANYEEAKPPTLKLSPHEALAKVVRRDYDQMDEMLFDEPEPFDDILKALAVLEAEINSLGTS